MDWKTFTVALVGNLVWPVFAAYVIWMIRKPINDLIPLIKSLRFKDLQLEFGQKLAEAKAEISDEIDAEVSEIVEDTETKNFEFLAALSPNGAVLHAWLPVESAIIGLAQREGLEVKKGTVLAPALTLVEANLISRATGKLIGDLARLRNVAAHTLDDKEISFSQALEFKVLADHVLKELSEA